MVKYMAVVNVNDSFRKTSESGAIRGHRCVSNDHIQVKCVFLCVFLCFCVCVCVCVFLSVSVCVLKERTFVLNIPPCDALVISVTMHVDGSVYIYVDLHLVYACACVSAHSPGDTAFALLPAPGAGPGQNNRIGERLRFLRDYSFSD